MIRYLLPLLVFIGLVGLLVVGLRHDPSIIPSPLIDKPAPAFALPTLQQPQASIGTQDMKGEVSVLNVWASWCVECRHEHPFLLELGKDNRIHLIGLNYKDVREDALAWLKQNGGNPYQASAYDEDGQVGLDYGVYGVPETFILDREGIIRYKYIGPINEQVLEEEIKPMLARLLEPSS